MRPVERTEFVCVNVPLVVARRRSVDSHGPIVFRAFTPVGADLANAFAPDLCRLEYRPLVAELVGPALKVTVIPQQGFEHFSPHRAVRVHETDIYREDSIVGNIPLAYIFLSSLMVELRFK